MSLVNSAETLPATKILPVWNQIRANGKNYFLAKGLPTRNDEAWKYTSVSTLKEASFEFHTKNKPAKNLALLAKTWLNKDFEQIVFVDGVLNSELSTYKTSKALEILEFQEVLSSKEKSSFLSQFQAARKKTGTIRQDSFEALNSAHAFSGIVIRAKKNQAAARPVQILFLQTQSRNAVYPKIFVIAENGSKLTLLETYAGVLASVNGTEKSLTNSVTEVIVEPNARLDYFRVQSEALSDVNIGTTRIFLQEFSHLQSLSYTTGAALSRHNLDIHCIGQQATAHADGLYLVSGTQHTDHHTWIDHVVGHCQTTQTYKGILDQSSRAVFNGQVVIHKDAQKASSEQVNHNLLLSQQAEADSKPELQIYADDVKATHGSTVGQLNAEELFYMLSRAIPRDQAVEMLSLGFVNDLVEKVENEKVKSFLREHLRQAYFRAKAKDVKS
jgi:Fe-S cluster assembly protein SufD